MEPTKKAPHSVTYIHEDGSETYCDAFTRFCDARDHVKNGISWERGKIKFARIHDDTGEPAILVDKIAARFL